MTTGADQSAVVVVDTNVLLAATDESRATHASATAFLTSDDRRLALTPQIVREYLVVATRPTDVNGLGLASRDAVANVDQFLAEMDVLSEGGVTTLDLRNIVENLGVTSKQVHDANIVAVALSHRATSIVTDNLRHFARFADLIAIEDLPHLPSV